MKNRYPILAAATLVAASAANAASGTWSDTGLGPSNWSDTTKWSSGTVADASGSTANFTSDITGPTTVTLDTNRTITTIVFGDANTATPGSWLLTGSNTLTLAGTTPTFTVNAGVSAEVATVVTGTSLRKNGPGTLTLSALNTYTGVTTLVGGPVNVTTLKNGGTASSLGQSGNAATNLILNGTTLNYVGTGDSTDRLFTLTASSAITNNGTSGALNFTNTGTVAFSGATATQLTLGGTHAGDNTFAVKYGDNGATLQKLIKSGAGKWIVTGANTYSNGTAVNSGTLVTGNTSALGAGTVTVGQTTGATLQIGNGTVNTVVLGAGANLAVLDGNTLKLGGLVAGALDGGPGAVVTLAGGGAFNFNATGALDLGGVLNGLSLGAHTYTLIAGGTGTAVNVANITGYDATVTDLSVSGGVLSFTAIAVPEPSTYGLLGAGALAAVALVRRRRAK